MKIKVIRLALSFFFLLGAVSSVYLIQKRSDINSPIISTDKTIQWTEPNGGDAMIPTDVHPDGQILDAIIQTLFNALPQSK